MTLFLWQFSSSCINILFRSYYVINPLNKHITNKLPYQNINLKLQFIVVFDPIKVRLFTAREHLSSNFLPFLFKNKFFFFFN